MHSCIACLTSWLLCASACIAMRTCLHLSRSWTARVQRAGIECIQPCWYPSRPTRAWLSCQLDCSSQDARCVGTALHCLGSSLDPQHLALQFTTSTKFGVLCWRRLFSQHVRSWISDWTLPLAFAQSIAVSQLWTVHGVPSSPWTLACLLCAACLALHALCLWHFCHGRTYDSADHGCSIACLAFRARSMALFAMDWSLVFLTMGHSLSCTSLAARALLSAHSPWICSPWARL